jgi:hypothetical protein
MSQNRRQFLSALGATGVVGAIAAEQVNAQVPQPVRSTPAPTKTPANCRARWRS